MSRKENDEFTKRVTELLGNEKDEVKSDKELTERFNRIFTAEQKDYSVPTNFEEQEISKEIEKMLYESDEEEDAIDDYIYNLLNKNSTCQKQGPVQHKMKQLEDTLLGPSVSFGTDESDLLIKRAIEENKLDEKYEKFAAERDVSLEERLKNIQSYSPQDNTVTNLDKPKGPIPKAILPDDLYDETDYWCCVCNEDANIECNGCEDENKFCTECFFQTHRSEFADYDSTQHKCTPFSRTSHKFCG